MRFRDLSIGATFTFPSLGPGRGTFFATCHKTSPRCYEWEGNIAKFDRAGQFLGMVPGTLHTHVGTINVEVVPQESEN